MKKLVILLAALISISLAFGQANKVDTVIKTDIYKSYLSYKSHTPLYVKYILKNGGGECSRKKNNYNFKEILGLNIAGTQEYKKSGYDKGHLANAEDFAYDCRLEKETFIYINCIPQYANLNRGVWKTNEEYVRELSQSDSLLVICGGVFKSNKYITGTKVMVPDNCFKIVYSLKTKQLLHIYWFTNIEKNNSMNEITREQLYKYLGYKIDLIY